MYEKDGAFDSFGKKRPQIRNKGSKITRHMIRAKNSMRVVTTVEMHALRRSHSADTVLCCIMLDIVIRQMCTFCHNDWLFWSVVGMPDCGD